VDNLYLTALIRELTPQLDGRRVSRVTQSGSTLLIDPRLEGNRQLLASLEPSSPALYLTSDDPVNDLKSAHTSTLFPSMLRKRIAGARILSVFKPPLDRIVLMHFEKLDAGDNKIRTLLQLSLTGRSSNALLIDAADTVLARLYDQESTSEPIQVNRIDEAFDHTSLTRDLSDSASQAEIVERLFGQFSIFGPQLRNEFLVRCLKASPFVALNSLIDDLFKSAPLALVYSRFPLNQIENRLISLKTDLLLSHIELTGASDMLRHQFSSLSEAAERFYTIRRGAMAISALYAGLKQILTREINKREAAMKAIESDRVRFEDPEKLKRSGDLLLANLADARIDGTRVTVVDYYDLNQRKIQIDIPEGATLEQAATDYFKRYQKARRALTAIASRESGVRRTLIPLKELALRLEQGPTSDRIDEVGQAVAHVLGTEAGPSRRPKHRKGTAGYAFGRRFKSSDGYEIVVGRNDRDNDALTFRVARPHDTWLHAADYPGSHVLVRNPTRKPMPHRTITEAAELAAFYSQAKRAVKAAVHYTQKKFVSKPPRSKPGLVRLSSFKTILVEPRCSLERLN
jgi:predicted ribosome quality control (RQC) complex YloA/Tae2 family protein